MNKLTKLLITTAICAQAVSFTATSQALDGVATVVNNGVILNSDITKLMAKIRATADPATLPPQDILQQQVLEQLIMDELQLQEATRMGIRIDDIRLDQAIAHIAQDNNKTVEQQRQELERSGITWRDYREQVRKEIIIGEVRSIQVRNRVIILPQEVEALEKQLNEQNKERVQYKLSHIQLNLNENANQAERDRVRLEAEQLVNQIKNGANFAAIAMAKSNGSRALEGGDWGWLNAAEMPTLFADQVVGHGKGAVIGPFRSGVGYHILKIDDVKGQENVAVEEIKARHILIKPTIIVSDEGAENQLKTLTRRIKSGMMTFDEAAEKYSADTGSAVKGGDLDWQTSDIYVPEFKNTIDRLPVGQISEPFKTVHGWHIVEVTGRRQADRTQEMMKNRAYRILLNRKFSEEVQAWLQELRAGAYVENMNVNK